MSELGSIAREALRMLNDKMPFIFPMMEPKKKDSLWQRVKFAYKAFKSGDIYSTQIEDRDKLIKAYEKGTDYRPEGFYIRITKPARFSSKAYKE